jgi:tellurite resistance protein
MVDHQTALIYVMVLASASDADMTDAELRRIGAITANLPIFQGYSREAMNQASDECIGLLEQDDGLDTAFDLIKESLPARLRETAYALACDVVAADGTVHQEELRFLELARHRLDIDRLIAAGIERGARARFTVSPVEAKELVPAPA